MKYWLVRYLWLLIALELSQMTLLSQGSGGFVQRYWPMHSGDQLNYAGAGETTTITFTADLAAGSFIMQESYDNASSYYTYSGSQLLLTGGKQGWTRMTYTPPIPELDENSLANGGTRSATSQTTVQGITVGLSAVITVANAGAVTVPAGTFQNCRTVGSSITGTVPGVGSQTMSVQNYVLAPGVGIIKLGLYDLDGRLIGWLELTGGHVDGVDVHDLANPKPPVITTQPQSQTVASGHNATFNVIASGTGPLSYQWKFNGVNLAGATASTLALSSVTTNQAGAYTVTVSNLAGSADSQSAALTVIGHLLTAPGKPTATQIASTTAMVNWSPSTDSQGHPLHYEVQYWEPQNMEHYFTIQNLAEAGVSLTELSPDTTYALLVKAIDDAGAWSDWSGQGSFTTLPTGMTRSVIIRVTGEAHSGASLSNGPHAVSWSQAGAYSSVNISAELFNASALSASGTAFLTTTLGAAATTNDLVAQAPFTLSPGGISSVGLFSGLNLAAGNYYLTLQAPEAAWGRSGTPEITLDAGVSRGGMYVASQAGSFAPGSNFYDYSQSFSGNLNFRVEGISATPHPDHQLSAPGKPVATDLMPTSATITWAPAIDSLAHPLHYEAQYWNVADVTQYWVLPGLTNTWAALSNLPPNAQFEIVVKALDNADASSAWSEKASFATPPIHITAPGKPAATEITSATAKITWAASSDSQGHALHYEVQCWNSADIAQYWTLSELTNTWVALTGLQPQTRYTLLLKALDDAAAWSDWSEKIEFQTSSAVPVRLSIVWPNGSPHLTLTGEPSVRYSVEYTPSLIPNSAWLILTNFTLTGSPFSITDPSSPLAPVRFYRAKQIP
jgi:hypothetical protein